MMKCEKCKFSFGKLEPNFCPNCGKQVKPFFPMRPALSNMDYLRLADEERFVRAWGEVAGKSGIEAYEWMLSATKDDVVVYAAAAEYLCIAKNCKGQIVCEEERVNSRVDFREFQRLVTDTATYPKVKIVAKPIRLTSKFSANTIGKTWWWEKTDCEDAIREWAKICKVEEKLSEE